MVIFGIVMIAFGIITTCLLAIVLVMIRRKAREIRGYLRVTDDRVSELSTLTHGVSVSLEALRQALAERGAQREENENAALELGNQVAKTLRMMAERLNDLPSREESAQAVERLESLLREAPEVFTRDGEAQLSQDIEKGISNILGYAVGKGRNEQS